MEKLNENGSLGMNQGGKEAYEKYMERK